MSKNFAILLRGHIRSYDILNQSIRNLENFLQKENKDYQFYFFIQSWSTLDWDHDNSPSKNILTCPNIINEIKKDAFIKIDDFDPNLNRIKSQYKSIHSVSLLKRQIEEERGILFDGALCTRSDFIINSKINLESINLNTYTFTEDEFGFADWFCISNPTLMDYYCNLYNQIDDLENYICKHGLFGNHIVDPHNILFIHLLKNGFCFSLEKMRELRISNQLYELNYKTELEQYYIDYCIKRVDGRGDASLKKNKL